MSTSTLQAQIERLESGAGALPLWARDSQLKTLRARLAGSARPIRRKLYHFKSEQSNGTATFATTDALAIHSTFKGGRGERASVLLRRISDGAMIEISTHQRRTLLVAAN